MARIQIIGESCRDIFVYCEAQRLAPDLPVPILQTVNTIENPGMAANVHRNIMTKISDCELLTNLNWKNITKTRYIHQESNHMFIRIDSPHEIEPIDMSKIDYNVDAIVISDYHKGFLSEEAINEICSKHDLVFLDTKKIVKSWAEKATFIKINDYEFRKSEKSFKIFWSPRFKILIFHSTFNIRRSFKKLNVTVFSILNLRLCI